MVTWEILYLDSNKKYSVFKDTDEKAEAYCAGYCAGVWAVSPSTQLFYYKVR